MPKWKRHRKGKYKVASAEAKQDHKVSSREQQHLEEELQDKNDKIISKHFIGSLTPSRKAIIHKINLERKANGL